MTLRPSSCLTLDYISLVYNIAYTNNASNIKSNVVKYCLFVISKIYEYLIFIVAACHSSCVLTVMTCNGVALPNPFLRKRHFASLV